MWCCGSAASKNQTLYQKLDEAADRKIWSYWQNYCIYMYIHVYILCIVLLIREGWTHVMWHHVKCNIADTAILSPLKMHDILQTLVLAILAKCGRTRVRPSVFYWPLNLKMSGFTEWHCTIDCRVKILLHVILSNILRLYWHDWKSQFNTFATTSRQGASAWHTSKVICITIFLPIILFWLFPQN